VAYINVSQFTASKQTPQVNRGTEQTKLFMQLLSAAILNTSKKEYPSPQQSCLVQSVKKCDIYVYTNIKCAVQKYPILSKFSVENDNISFKIMALLML
jgi:hypothetical protein